MSAVMASSESANRTATESRQRLVDGAASIGAVKKMTAIERLEASRSRLRNEMVGSIRPAKLAHSGAVPAGRAALDGLRRIPGVALVAETVMAWWAKHPMHDASVIAREASGAIFRPMARDNPSRLVFGALIVGALLVILKPWRFILRSAIFAGLVPQLIALALRRLPITTWIGMFARRTKASARSGAQPPRSRRDESPRR